MKVRVLGLVFQGLVVYGVLGLGLLSSNLFFQAFYWIIGHDGVPTGSCNAASRFFENFMANCVSRASSSAIRSVTSKKGFSLCAKLRKPEMVFTRRVRFFLRIRRTAARMYLPKPRTESPQLIHRKDS